MEDELNRPFVGYTCPSCGFDTDITNCDICDAIVKWDNDERYTAHCTGCEIEITYITCRKCGEEFSL